MEVIFKQRKMTRSKLNESNLSKLIRKVLNEQYKESEGVKEQKNVEGRCRPDQVKKLLSTLNSSRKFSIEVSEKDPNEIRVKDADGRSECLVRRNQIFKSA